MWNSFIDSERKKNYYKNLEVFLKNEYKTKTIFPPYEDVFNAFEYCLFEKTKVIILGQDPYHGEKQANGLAFSVNDEMRFPPSLRNIYKEINK